jgi:hypothetical protein
MTDAFVPLIAPASGGAVAQPSGPVRLKPISAAPGAFEHSTPATLSAQTHQANGTQKPAAVSPPPTPPATACEPKVTFERQGETITHIRIQCGCGQVMELKCEY